MLFGGENADGGGMLGDTWLWDGARWTQSAATGPGARTGASMAAYGDQLLLFGGSQVPAAGNDSAGVFLSDTWSWDGSAWSQVSATGPSPRANFAMVGQ